ncbi:2-dehydro-3-deoxyglucarate aldolase [Candidatus Poribacteria bacterium]|nr:2-dehydro-3-deoxyglucarate aldolase [Candidatus Poribacteria bacterium]
MPHGSVTVEGNGVKTNTTKRLLAEGKPAVGSWISLCSSISAEYMAHLGFDWLVVDTEHSPVGFETMVQCFQAICTTPTMPMVRVANNDVTLIKRVLDAGAMGIVVPMVLNAEEAKQAVAAAKYPPVGIRSVGGGRCMVYGDDYFTWANDETCVIVQIEHIEAVQRTEEILSVSGVDAAFIGPNDLAWSMGTKPGTPDHEAAIQQVLATAKRMRRAVGIHTPSGGVAKQRIEQGFQFVAIASDAAYAKAYGQVQLAEARSARI